MKCILTAVFSTWILLASAQTVTNNLNYKTAINISPIALMDVDNGVMLGGEYRFSQRVALSLDVAYLFSTYYFSQVKKVSGFNVRPAFRYYLNKKKDNEFVQLQGFYKKVDYAMHGWLDKNLVNNVPTYSQLQDFTYHKDVWGFNFMAGQLQPFTSSRFFLDIAAGFGVRFKKEGLSEPNSRMQRQGIFNLERREKQTTISIPLSVKLSYRMY